MPHAQSSSQRIRRKLRSEQWPSVAAVTNRFTQVELPDNPSFVILVSRIFNIHVHIHVIQCTYMYVHVHVAS